jgi:hypothetical protein
VKVCGRNGLVRSSASYPHTCPLSTPRRPTKRSPTPHARTHTHTLRQSASSQQATALAASTQCTGGQQQNCSARARLQHFPPLPHLAHRAHPLPRSQSDLQHKISAYQEITFNFALPYTYLYDGTILGPLFYEIILNKKTINIDQDFF